MNVNMMEKTQTEGNSTFEERAKFENGISRELCFIGKFCILTWESQFSFIVLFEKWTSNKILTTPQNEISGVPILMFVSFILDLETSGKTMEHFKARKWHDLQNPMIQKHPLKKDKWDDD